MSHGALPGFRDIYPAEFAERTFIVEAWREVARRYGFVEYDGPPLEPLELYTRKSGDEIVDQLYTFTDRGGRAVALRPEMTPTLARMVAARANAMRKPVRWMSIPQLFRYERQQKGRLREHLQLNMDILGEADVTADAELLSAAIDIMRVAGLTAADVRARVSDRRLLQQLLTLVGVSAEQLPTVFGAVDKLERQPRAALEETLARGGIAAPVIARIFEMLGIRDLSTLRAAYGAEPGLQDIFESLERYFDYLDALGVAEWVHFDLAIVRGLAYYTGIVFELFDARGEFRAICGGGRYDTLLQALGGVDMPALGFGMGDVVLGHVLRARGLMPEGAPALELWVAYASEESLPNAMRVVAALRARGRSVEYALGHQKLARQLRAAGAAGAREVLVVGAADIPPGEAILRRMADGQQEQVALDAWIGTQGKVGV
ncbi:MAG TPA: histidine--tRNA ligase [Gemmatimonadaceae bacterium]|nr:histidine--tRNA ligase [Gemmatimonadaceae bacterium]